MTDQLTRAQLRKILKAIRAVADIDKATRNAIVCALVGHSRIWMPGKHCARCGSVQKGEIDDAVLLMCGCDSWCRANYAKLTWRDKLYVRDPFKEGK